MRLGNDVLFWTPPRPFGQRRDAAALACTLKVARAACHRSKWPRAVRIGRSGAVLEPCSGAFDVTVAPGEDVQAAVDRCPRGGCVLLLPGTHEGPLVLAAGTEVHVFGRGRAALRAASGKVLTSESAVATVDGLIIRRESGADSADYGCGVRVQRGALRVQACDITSKSVACVCIQSGADPLLLSCRFVTGRVLFKVARPFPPFPPPVDGCDASSFQMASALPSNWCQTMRLSKGRPCLHVWLKPFQMTQWLVGPHPYCIRARLCLRLFYRSPALGPTVTLLYSRPSPSFTPFATAPQHPRRAGLWLIRGRRGRQGADRGLRHRAEQDGICADLAGRRPFLAKL